MNPGYASLCFLSFNRPKTLREGIHSALDNAGYPCEIVVHDDGSLYEVQRELLDMLTDGLISSLVLEPCGHNEGVGRSINRAFAVATGDPVCKLDQDLTFESDWLKKAVTIVEEDDRLGMLGLFKYHVEPVRWQDMELKPGWSARHGIPYHYVKDFVGSAMIIPRDHLAYFGVFPEHSDAFAEDVEYKLLMQKHGYSLGLPDEDLATNRGFGVGPSTVVTGFTDGVGQVQPIHHGPRVFNVS